MLQLVQTDWGRFDLALEDPVTSAGDDAQVATLIYAALFTDTQAPRGRVADPQDRRGWWASPQAGSGLWYVRRQALTDAARREAVDMVYQALAQRTPALSELSVEPVQVKAAQGVTTAALMIRGLSAGRPFLVRIPL